MRKENLPNKRISLGYILNAVILIALAICTLYPFWYVACVALSEPQAVVGAGMLLLPNNFSFESIQYVLTSKDFSPLFVNTFFVVIVGTLLSVIASIGIAYPLARKVKGNKAINYLVFITMIFSGGMIPTYLVVRYTGLLDNIWALILPRICDPFNIMLLRNSFATVPESLDESADLDGANLFTILLRIIIPVSLPGITTVALFYGVAYWNNFIDAVLYINDRSKWTVQVLLREILITAQPDQLGGVTMSASGAATTSQTIKMATVLLSAVPVMCIYPFVQKYFVSGVMVGAVKG